MSFKRTPMRQAGPLLASLVEQLNFEAQTEKTAERFGFFLSLANIDQLGPLGARDLAHHLLSVSSNIPIHFTSNHGSNEMLVLSRKEGEQLMIGEDIVLTINRISGNRVAIGIDAPRDVRIVRGELQRRDAVSGGSAPMAMEETNIAIASQPH